MLAHIPNLLTLLRIVACPVLVLVLDASNYPAALAIFLAAGITDGLDGYIAKRFNCVSKLGTILDPIADKLLISCAYVMLAMIGDIPFYLLVIVIFRDMMIIIGYFVLITVMAVKAPIGPIYTSKINTFLQITLVVFVLLEKSLALTMPGILSYTLDVLVISVLISSVVSGLQYGWYCYKSDMLSDDAL